MNELLLDFTAALIGCLIGEIPIIKRYFDKLEANIKEGMRKAALRAY
jgi:hypothetical protein